jgi:hypothetical protein
MHIARLFSKRKVSMVVFPDLLKEEESCAFSVDGGMHRDEMCMLH